MRVDTVILPSVETTAKGSGTCSSFLLVTQSKSSSGPVAPGRPLLFGGEARVFCGTSAQNLSSVWADKGSCSSEQGLHEGSAGSIFLCKAGGDTGHLVV